MFVDEVTLLASSTKKSLVWGGISLLMLLSVLSPIRLITLHLLLVPLIVMAVLASTKLYALLYAGMMVILILLLQDYGIVLAILSLVYAIPAFVMARQYRKAGSSSSAIVAGVVAWIAVILLLLLVSFAMQFNLSEFMEELLLNDPVYAPIFISLFGSENQVRLAIALLIDMIPLMIITFAVYTTVLAHYFSRMILTAIWRPIPKLKPMKEWRLPRSLLWYFLILLIIDLFTAAQPGTTLHVVLANAVPLLTFAMALQGIGFLFYLADVKRWNRVLPISVIVGCILFMPLVQLVAWVGILDMAFPLRERLKSNE